MRNLANPAALPTPALRDGEQVNEENVLFAEPQTTAAGAVYYYHYDAQGNVEGMSNASGAGIGVYGYDSYGRDVRHSGVTGTNAVKFSSKEWENYAGLYYFGGRYYDAETGRWLTPDPLGMADGLNKYLYVHNNPLNMVDPWGLEGKSSSNFDTATTASIPVYIPSGIYYDINGYDITVPGSGTTLDINVSIGSNGWAVTSITSSNLIVNNVFGSVDVHIDFVYIDASNAKTVLEGNVLGIPFKYTLLNNK